MFTVCDTYTDYVLIYKYLNDNFIGYAIFLSLSTSISGFIGMYQT